MSLTDKESSGKGIFFILILVVLILVIAFFVGGAGGIFSVIKIALLIIFVVGFFGFAFYIIYYLFFMKHRIDLTYENWKSYVRSGKDNGSDMMESLILTGDKNHSGKIFMRITGYLRVKNFENEEYDMFIGKRSPNNPFEEDKLVMMKPEQHSDLIGDVYVYGISLIQKYGFYFLNTNLLDYKAIDEFISKDTFRSVMYVTLGDIKTIVDRAVGLDSDAIKRQQDQKLLKIPILTGQQNQGGGNSQ